MWLERSLTLFTYSPRMEPDEPRWADTGIPRPFFDTLDAARSAVLDLREEVLADPDEVWSAICIERIETPPLSNDALLALLNGGVGAVLKSCEIVKTIE